MLVSISIGAEPRRAVPASLPIADESLTKVAPSTRQNFSASTVSTRLHWGQRFIVYGQLSACVYSDDRDQLRRDHQGQVFSSRRFYPTQSCETRRRFRSSVRRSIPRGLRKGPLIWARCLNKTCPPNSVVEYKSQRKIVTLPQKSN